MDVESFVDVSYADLRWCVGWPSSERPVAFDIVFDLVMRVFGEVVPPIR